MCSAPYVLSLGKSFSDYSIAPPFQQRVKLLLTNLCPACLRRCVPSRTRCYTGLRSLRMTVPPGLMGGAFINTTVKEGWLYVVKARVFHEEAPPTDALGLSMATRLVLWDMRDVKEASMPAKQYGEWEVGGIAGRV